MSTHSTLSPSSRHRWAACPASVREEKNYPDRPGGPAAIDGTHSHTLLEHCIKCGLIDPNSMVGAEMSDHDGKFTVDRERASRVKVAIDYIIERKEATGGTVLAETRVDPAYLVGRNDMGGTVDVQIVAEGILEIIDYKDGMKLVVGTRQDIRFLAKDMIQLHAAQKKTDEDLKKKADAAPAAAKDAAPAASK